MYLSLACSGVGCFLTETTTNSQERVTLVTDSSACLPVHEVAANPIVVLPTVLIWRGKVLRDGVDISSEMFWRRLVTDPVAPSTSTMPPSVYADAFEYAGRRDSGVVCVVIPRRFSAMADVARLAASGCDEKFDIRVVETGGSAMAHGFPVLLGARAANAGANQDAVEGAVRRASAGSGIVAVLDSLDYLARSGRVPAVIARMADALPSTVVFSMRHGGVRIGATFGSRERAITSLVTRVRRASRNAGYLGVTVHHAANVSEGHELAERIHRALRPNDLFVTCFTPVMGAHVGPGLIGIAYCALPS